MRLKLGSPEVQEEVQQNENKTRPVNLATTGNENSPQDIGGYRQEHPEPSAHPSVEGNFQRNTYCVVVPPPNLTGDLHMGHAFEHYLMDTLVRINRQRGKTSLYFPGVDHAGIQLEGVINKLINRGDFDEEIRANSFLVNEQGESIFIFFELPKEDRANFLKQNFPDIWLKFAWEKVHIWRGNQVKQAEKLGDSPDFDRLLFTLDPRAVDMVNYAFIKYWQDGLIHKGSYLINWSVALQTALSDVPEDISHEERKDPFITFEYEITSVKNNLGENDVNLSVLNEIASSLIGKRIQVGTVRPETVFGDVAVAVHPNKIKDIFKISQASADLLTKEIGPKGVQIFVSIKSVGLLSIPLIVDEAVDPNFGTGALKITPASDIVDYNIAAKHGFNHLPQSIGRDGKLTEICGEFAGLTVEQGRMAVIKRLIEDGYVPTQNGFEENRESVQNKPSVEKLSDPEFRNLSLEKQKEYLQKNYPQYQIDWNYVHNVTICERSKSVVEPLISEEFFIDYYAKFKHQPIQNSKFKTQNGNVAANFTRSGQAYESSTLNQDNAQIQNVPLVRGETAGFGVVSKGNNNNQNLFQNGEQEVSATPGIGEETTLQKLAIAGIGQTNFFPEEYKERALNYFETIKNWCISRDLIWGHKMPVWYNLDVNPERRFYSFEEMLVGHGGVGHGGDAVVAATLQFAVQVEKPSMLGNWVQETKILDTWFSSTLWPLTTLNYLDFANGKKGTDFEKFYPTQTMTTAKEIFYAWIVRMIMTGMYFAGQTPFENYLAHAWVLDDKGKKMSKSLGNVIDVADQIEKYSSDAVRLGMLEKSIPGRNIRFGGKLGDTASEKYRNFGNKLWNVARFLEGKEAEILVAEKLSMILED